MPTLSMNVQKARFGVSYLMNVASQAGFGINEWKQDEDVLAVDCSAEFAEGSIRIQVKCTSRYELDREAFRLDLEPTWVEKRSDPRRG